MATEIRHKGPVIGQIAKYQTGSGVIAAIITGINQPSGTISMTTFPAGSAPGTASTVTYDPTGVASNSWHWSEDL